MAAFPHAIHARKRQLLTLPSANHPACLTGYSDVTRAHGHSILVVEDEPSIASFVSMYLERAGFAVRKAETGAGAIEQADAEAPSLVILDLMLPDLDGIDVCRRIRQRSDVPILMLTARDDDIDKIIGLEVGADDYITKPFSMREFRSRVKAALRRSRMAAETTDEGAIESGELSIDFDRRMVTLRDEEISVTYVEFEILGALARSPGRVLTRETLLEHVWGDSEYRDPRTVDVHIRHLREKLEQDPKQPEFLFTVRGVGYRFKE